MPDKNQRDEVEDGLERVHESWAAEALAAQAAVSHEAVEAYIASLSWDWASAEARMLVAGNIRAFGAKIRAALEAAFDSATRLPPAPTPERAAAERILRRWLVASSPSHFIDQSGWLDSMVRATVDEIADEIRLGMAEARVEGANGPSGG